MPSRVWATGRRWAAGWPAPAARVGASGGASVGRPLNTTRNRFLGRGGMGAGLRIGAAGGACLVLTAATVAVARGGSRQAGAFYALALAAFVVYLVALWLLRSRSAPVVGVVLVAATIQLAGLARPLLLSQDVLAYWAYGRVAALDGGNPYSEPPAAFRSDPAVRAMSPGWRATTSVYGPLFTLGTEAAALAVGRSQSAAETLYKALAAVGAIALTILAAMLSRRPAFAAAMVGWSPLLAIHLAGGGHNDAWMMTPLLAALALERRGRRQFAGALWMIAAAVKWIPLLLLPLSIAENRRTRPIGLGALAAAASLAVAATVCYGDEWLRAFHPLVHNADLGTRLSLDHLLHPLGLSHSAAEALLLAGFACAFALLLRHAWHGASRLGLTTALLVLATPWLLPWYGCWTIPLAAAEDDYAALILALLLTGYLLLAPVFL